MSKLTQKADAYCGHQDRFFRVQSDDHFCSTTSMFNKFSFDFQRQISLSVLRFMRISSCLKLALPFLLFLLFQLGKKFHAFDLFFFSVFFF